jgi:hypothetical protein
MAKLKIFEGNNPAGNLPNKEGYIDVATGLIADFNNFDSASERDRSDLLQGYAGKHTIYQLTRNPANDVAIDRNNCKVKIESDERKKPSVNFGKHNIVLPEIQAADPPLDTGYLSEYVKAIDALYGAGSATELDRACKFLFGIMLLTRCR